MTKQKYKRWMGRRGDGMGWDGGSRGLAPLRPGGLWSALVRLWPAVNPVDHWALASITPLALLLLLIYFSIDRRLSVARVTFAHWY